MTVTQIRSEIEKALNAIPESNLEDILTFLQELQNHSSKDINQAANLKKILVEDKELLQKLAQ